MSDLKTKEIQSELMTLHSGVGPADRQLRDVIKEKNLPRSLEQKLQAERKREEPSRFKNPEKLLRISNLDLEKSVNQRSRNIESGINDILLIPLNSPLLPEKLNEQLSQSRILREDLQEQKRRCRQSKAGGKVGKNTSKKSEPDADKSYDETVDTLDKHDSLIKEMQKQLEEFQKAGIERKSELIKAFEETKQRLKETTQRLLENLVKYASEVSKLLSKPESNKAQIQGKPQPFDLNLKSSKGEDSQDKKDKDQLNPFVQSSAELLSVQSSQDEDSEVIHALKIALGVSEAIRNDDGPSEGGSLAADDKEKSVLIKGDGLVQHQYRDLSSIEHEINQKIEDRDRKVADGKALSK